MGPAPSTRPRGAYVAVCGDVHGHLQLAACAWALEAQRGGRAPEALLLCGDVGTFTDAAPPDAATVRHARQDPCELEFPRAWSRPTSPAWLQALYAPTGDGGLGWSAPIVMVSGNHEGFAHLAALRPADRPSGPVPAEELPAVDPFGRVRLLPSGWRLRTPSGLVVGGVGGIEPGQRAGADYHPDAYLAATDVDVVRGQAADVLLTHQGPAAVQGASSGSPTLDRLLDRPDDTVWFHGHSRATKDPQQRGATTVVPLGDATFDARDRMRVRTEGWARVWRDGDRIAYDRHRPAALPELRFDRWVETDGGAGRVAPHLAAWA